MKKVTILCLLVIAVFGPPAYADLTTKTFREAKAAGGHNWALAQMYVMGAGEAYMAANAALLVEHKQLLYCQLGNLGLSADNYVNILQDEIPRWGDRSSDDLAMVLILLAGLEYTFPCK
jgi:hypothetical protein